MNSWQISSGKNEGATLLTERLEELNEELEILNAEARELQERIAENVAKLLEEAI